MKAVPPDPTHLKGINVKTKKTQSWEIRELISTGKPGLYLKFEISAGYLLVGEMLDIITTKLKTCTRSLSVCSWATQNQDPRTQETCTRRGCSPCRSHRTWSSPGWGNDWQRSCTVYDFFDCSKLAFLQVFTLTGVVILHIFWFLIVVDKVFVQYSY